MERKAPEGHLKACPVYNTLCHNTLQIPEENALNKTSINMTYVFFGDGAYPLPKYLLKPHSKQQLDSDKKYALGIIYPKCRILSKATEM
jgi:hypothetical protein